MCILPVVGGSSVGFSDARTEAAQDEVSFDQGSLKLRSVCPAVPGSDPGTAGARLRCQHLDLCWRHLNKPQRRGQVRFLFVRWQRFARFTPDSEPSRFTKMSDERIPCVTRCSGTPFIADNGHHCPFVWPYEHALRSADRRGYFDPPVADQDGFSEATRTDRQRSPVLLSKVTEERSCDTESPSAVAVWCELPIFGLAVENQK